ncbi:MAG TPA: M48 family metallopeptidase [Ktedonobacterales bacterium]|nr:M48 family metallopeptidase [Ktedonobacterales bacterium]
MTPEQAVIRSRRSFKGTAWESIQHPDDRAALDALKQIPLLDKAVAWVMEQGWERMLYIQNISSSVKVTPRQCPRVWYLFSEANRILGVDDPVELYIMQHPMLNAYTFGNKKPFIMLHSATVDGMNDDQLLAVIGHEIGHVLSGHSLYLTMIALLQPFIEFGLRYFPGGAMAILAVRTALSNWRRASELTGDRFGLLTCQDPETMVQVMMKLAGGATDEHRDPLEFLAQAEAYKNLDKNFLDGLFKLMMVLPMPHPLVVVRAAEVMSWSQSRQYLNMMSD